MFERPRGDGNKHLMGHRKYGRADRAIMLFDALLGATGALAAEPDGSSPADGLAEGLATPDERTAAARLMRVNHTGEVCAQALYLGQAALATDDALVELMEQAAHEERAHLGWCKQRLQELDSRPSLLDPAWFAGSFALGALAAATGDARSLGFLEETERQVVQHLEEHLERLPAADRRSRAVLQRMRRDEARHAETAARAGATRLPVAVRLAMRAQAGLMKVLAARF